MSVRTFPTLVTQGTRTRRTRFLAATVVALWALAADASVAQTNSPGWEWTTASPESQGMSSAKLKAMTEALAARNTSGLLVVRNDRIVCEWYAPGAGAAIPHGTASLAKAIVGGVAAAVAITDGRVALDDPAAKFIPQWQGDPRKSRITLRQLGSHTSGLADAEDQGLPHEKLTGWQGDFWKRLSPPRDPFSIARDVTTTLFEPGERFEYSNPGIGMLVYALTAALRDAPQKDIRALLRERVMGPIGVPDAEWSIGYNQTFTVDDLPLIAAWGGGNYTARAAARLGRLMLRQGDWEGRGLLSPGSVRAVTSDAGTPGPCGIGWWSNNDGHCACLPRDAYWGAGAGHQTLLVVPSLNLIAVRNGLELGPLPTAIAPVEYASPTFKWLFEPLMDAITNRAPPVTIGAGSGHLDYIDAPAMLQLRPGDTLRIRPGVYSGLSLGNLAGSPEAPITVVCDFNTVFTTRNAQPNEFTNIAHVHFENFRFENYNGTCLHFTGQSHDLVFKDFHFTNISGYCFHIYDPAKVFNGTRESTFYNFKWENVIVDGKVNGAAISSSDWQPVSNLKSVLLDFEVVRCTFLRFDNSRLAFPVIGLDKCFNLQVHDCTFSDIGVAESPIGHNVCICGAGYFKVFNNRFTRQWANDVRVWPMKLNALGCDGPDAVNRFYNNISWEKRKYPMCEHNQVPQKDLDNSSGYLSGTSSEVFFNTLYRSRKAAGSQVPYVGVLVDVYGPAVTIKHNLVIEPEADAPFDPGRNYVFQLGAGPQPGVVAENNLVFRTMEEAGIVDTTSFMPAAASPAKDAATGRVEYILLDHYGRERYVGPAADVGGVENQQVSPVTSTSPPGNRKPLFGDFMGLNGHFTFKLELYRQVGHLVRNYHNLNWDVKQPGEAITVPVCINQVNWRNDVYGRWQKAG